MLHDNLITENFLHHVQKEQSLSPPQSNSSTKMNLYHSLRYEQMQHQLINQQLNINNNNNQNKNQKQQSQHHNRDDDEVLDLSRRCNSYVDSTSLTKTPSSSPLTSLYHQNSSLSPTTINLENHKRKSISPVTQQKSNHHTEISASLLAENLQKFYCQQNLLPTKSILSNTSLLHNTQSTQSSSLPLQMYPVYYTQIKQEPIDTINHHNHQKQQKDMDIPVISPRNTLLQIPQSNISIHNNLLLSSSSNGNYPNVQSNLPILPNHSPKSGLKPDSTDIDRMSDASSIPGSPSSTTSIIYPKLLNSSNSSAAAATIMQNLNQSSVVGDYQSNHNNNNNNGSKPTRPFKAFPRDPLVIAANFAATDVLYDNPRVERYTEYRKRVLEQIRSANGGERTISNPKMRRLNTRNNFNNNNHNNNNNNSTNISSDGSYSDSQANNSETEDRANDSFSDNDTICNNKSTNYDLNCNSNDDSNLNNNNDELKSKNKEKNNNNNGLDNQHGQIKDAAYYERRRKNNAAAKKSRDRRRIKEDEIAIRAAYLERQNIELLCQLDALKAQLAALTKVQV